jgi:hypothetical protein
MTNICGVQYRNLIYNEYGDPVQRVHMGGMFPFSGDQYEFTWIETTVVGEGHYIEGELTGVSTYHGSLPNFLMQYGNAKILIYRIDFDLLGHEKNSSGTPCPILTFFCEFLRINNPLNRNGLSPYFLAIRCYGEYNDIWIDIITFFSDGKYMLTSTQGDKNYFFEKISDVPFF